MYKVTDFNVVMQLAQHRGIRVAYIDTINQ